MAEQTGLTAAARGIKKVYVSELLRIVASVLYATEALISGDGLLWSVLGGIAFAALAAGTVFEISGLRTAAPDENGYRLAYRLSVIELCALGVTIIAVVIWPDLSKDGTDDLIYRLVDVFISYTMLKTTVDRLTARGHADIARLGKPTLFLTCACYGAQAFFSALNSFIAEGSVFMNVITVIFIVLGVPASILLALFLGKSWKRL